jgi:hypothetical protein
MNAEDDRLTPELQSLLLAEKEAAGPDAGARDRVAHRLAQTLGVTLAAAGVSTAATSGAQTVLPKALVGKSLAAKLLVAAVVGAVGAGGIVTTVKLVHRRSATHAAPRRIEPAPALAPPPAAAPLVAAPSLSAVDEPPSSEATPPRHEAHHAPRHDDLAAERALLADARAAMQSSDAARALAILDDHARRFAHGQLAEERDALRVAALWLAGDHAAARRHADEFARHHPDSLFLPSVERAIQE